MGSACSSCIIVARTDVDNQYFFLRVPRVGYYVCCNISAGLIRPNDLYATFYMGLFFDMLDLTSLIPYLQCPIMQADCKQSVRGGNVTILEDHDIGYSKQKPVYVHVSYSELFLRKNYFTVQEF
jgi:hypothetical protein